MKKDITMKKNSFVKGAFITTLGIVISKILGIVYVIPFHAIIGERGGALYGYAYTIYLFFMSISTAGIPLAISKIVSEYQTLGYYNAKKKVFAIGKKIALLLGFISFLLIMIFAPLLARAVMGDVTGGNSISDIAFVIRVIGTAILVVPVLSIYRGYFEGHRFMSPPSISQVIEQVIRVIIIIFGSLLALKSFNLSLTSSVGVALFGATVGALASYMYLAFKHLKNKKRFDEKIRPVNEPYISEKVILKKILIYAIPFILIDIFKSLYNYIDMFTVVKGLVNQANFTATDAESVYSILSTWAAKFNMIILAVSTGIIVSLIPNLEESVVKEKKSEINKRISQAISILLFLTIPMTLGVSFLAKPIWFLFYGESKYGASILSYYIFAGLAVGLFTAGVTILQALKDYKSVFISLITGVMIKLILNINLLIAFNKMSFPPYYGIITASIFGYITSFIICLILLHKKYEINFEESTNNFIEVLCGSILMAIGLFILKLFIPSISTSRLLNIVIIIFYALIGSLIYFIYTIKTGTFKRVFGRSFKSILKGIKK